MKIYTAAMLIEIARQKSQQSQPQAPARDAARSQTYAAKPDIAFATAASR